MLAMTEAEQFAPLAEIEMLSLGAGNTPWPYAKDDMTDPGIATIASVTFDIAYSGPESAMSWLAQHRLGDRYKRINPIIRAFEIDDASEATLLAMQKAAQLAIAPQ